MNYFGKYNPITRIMGIVRSWSWSAGDTAIIPAPFILEPTTLTFIDSNATSISFTDSNATSLDFD